MKKILLFLLLGVFCFSTEGFKNLKWGSSKQEVINTLGAKYKSDKKKDQIIYEKIDFADENLTKATFGFVDEKLVNWSGSIFIRDTDAKKIIDTYISKYGMNPLSKDMIKDIKNSEHKVYGEIVFSYEDKNGIILIDQAPYMSAYGVYFVQLSIFYRAPYTELERKSLDDKKQQEIQDKEKNENKIKTDI